MLFVHHVVEYQAGSFLVEDVEDAHPQHEHYHPQHEDEAVEVIITRMPGTVQQTHTNSGGF
jgi:hypothetical protein